MEAVKGKKVYNISYLPPCRHFFCRMRVPLKRSMPYHEHNFFFPFHKFATCLFLKVLLRHARLHVTAFCNWISHWIFYYNNKTEGGTLCY